jgi:hypothetical protein
VGAPDGRLERVPTETLDVWKRHVAMPVEDSVGALAATTWPRGEAALW